MNYWPATAILQELREPEQRRELMSIGTKNAQMSEITMIACRHAASRLRPCTSLVLICSEDTPIRRVYLEHPTEENWTALERGGFFMAFNNFGFVMDALH